MSEQQTTSTSPHPEVVGTRWGDPISEKRQEELQRYLDRWAAEADRGERKGPFDGGPGTEGVPLTGADVAWLAENSGRDTRGGVPNLHLEGAYLNEADLERADLNGAHLEGAYLHGAHLVRARLIQAHLEGTNLIKADLWQADIVRAHLEEAALVGASIRDAFLGDAHLEGAYLGMAYLVGTDLRGAHLEEAHLDEADLQKTDLRGTHLEGANLDRAHLEEADLRNAWLDSKTVLSDTVLDSKTHLGDIQWSGVGSVNLTRINWGRISRLGDEQGVGLRAKAADHEAVVRAYRQLATQLRAQGINEVADRFAYRAQVTYRRLLLRRLSIPQYLGSLLLDLVSGHGFKPGRSFITYLLVIVAFATAFFTIGTGILGIGGHEAINSPVSALVFSVTSFHGRGFFPGGGLALDDPITILAALEAIMGLFIEITFIATFTQRFFAR